MGGAIECADCHPATVPADRDVLYTGRGGPAEESVRVMNSRLSAQPWVGEQVEDVERVTICTGSDKQTATGEKQCVCERVCGVFVCVCVCVCVCEREGVCVFGDRPGVEGKGCYVSASLCSGQKMSNYSTCNSAGLVKPYLPVEQSQCVCVCVCVCVYLPLLNDYS